MNTCISCVKRQYPSRTLKLSHIELCQYCRGGPDGKPGSCIPFLCFVPGTQHGGTAPASIRLNKYMLYCLFCTRDTAPGDGPRLEPLPTLHVCVFFIP